MNKEQFVEALGLLLSNTTNLVYMIALYVLARASILFLLLYCQDIGI